MHHFIFPNWEPHRVGNMIIRSTNSEQVRWLCGQLVPRVWVTFPLIRWNNTATSWQWVPTYCLDISGKSFIGRIIWNPSMTDLFKTRLFPTPASVIWNLIRLLLVHPHIAQTAGTDCKKKIYNSEAIHAVVYNKITCTHCPLSPSTPYPPADGSCILY